MPRFILELPTHFCSNSSYITAVSSEIAFLLLEGYPFKLPLIMAISVKLCKYLWECRFLGRNFSSSVPWLLLFLFRSELSVLLSLLWRIFFSPQNVFKILSLTLIVQFLCVVLKCIFLLFIWLGIHCTSWICGFCPYCGKFSPINSPVLSVTNSGFSLLTFTRLSHPTHHLAKLFWNISVGYYLLYSG